MDTFSRETFVKGVGLLILEKRLCKDLVSISEDPRVALQRVEKGVQSFSQKSALGRGGLVETKPCCGLGSTSRVPQAERRHAGDPLSELAFRDRGVCTRRLTWPCVHVRGLWPDWSSSCSLSGGCQGNWCLGGLGMGEGAFDKAVWVPEPSHFFLNW